MTVTRDRAIVEPRARMAPVPLVLGGLLLVASVLMPLWGPPLLARLAFFRLRKVEVIGAHYTPVADIVSRLRVDTSHSVWIPLAPLEARVASHPQILLAAVSRKLPGTLVVRVTERRPVALVTRADGLRAVDERGVQLPLDPSRTPVDAPIIVAAPRAVTVYHLLGTIQREAPRLYARISSIRAEGRDELMLQVSGFSVRAMTSVSVARLSDIDPVERDLARRKLRAAELDLRYRDQVIARLP